MARPFTIPADTRLERIREALSAARAEKIRLQDAETRIDTRIDQLESELFDAEDAAGNVLHRPVSVTEQLAGRDV